MEQININNARANLSQLIMKAAAGEPFIITRFGRPMVMVSPCVSREANVHRVGFLKGKIKVPADFDTMGAKEILGIFHKKG